MPPSHQKAAEIVQLTHEVVKGSNRRWLDGWMVHLETLCDYKVYMIV